jgi:hypothetical protein
MGAICAARFGPQFTVKPISMPTLDSNAASPKGAGKDTGALHRDGDSDTLSAGDLDAVAGGGDCLNADDVLCVGSSVGMVAISDGGAIGVSSGGGTIGASVLGMGGLSAGGTGFVMDSADTLGAIEGGGGPMSVGNSILDTFGDVGGGLGVMGALGGGSCGLDADFETLDQLVRTKTAPPLRGNHGCVQPERAAKVDSVVGSTSGI